MGWPVHWQQVTPVTRLARPAAALFGRLASHRKQTAIAQQQTLPVPLIVVGNIVVGGTGKTPLIAWLTTHLKQRGLTPGIISRGHGGRRKGPWLVRPDDPAEDVGDEPLQLQQQTGSPVCIGRDRPAAARHLLARVPDINVLISDDGLQHYRLARQLEFCLFDGTAGIGNGELLPAGPLREPLKRLDEADLVICKGRSVPALALWNPLVMLLTAGTPKPLAGSLASGRAVPSPRSQEETALAVCGIGQPESFFQLLRDQGWAIERMPLPDHGALKSSQISAMKGRTVLMTSKDAVKLRGRALPCAAYEVPLQVAFDQRHLARLDAVLDTVLASGVAEHGNIDSDQRQT